MIVSPDSRAPLNATSPRASTLATVRAMTIILLGASRERRGIRPTIIRGDRNVGQSTSCVARRVGTGSATCSSVADALNRTPTVTEIRPWVAPMVRVGYAAKGLIYLLTGVLALRLAVGMGGRITDASGVLRTFVRQPFGWILLTVIAVGILAYAAWQVTEALMDTRHKGGGVRGWLDRSLTIIKAAVYGTI